MAEFTQGGIIDFGLTQSQTESLTLGATLIKLITRANGEQFVVSGNEVKALTKLTQAESMTLSSAYTKIAIKSPIESLTLIPVKTRSMNIHHSADFQLNHLIVVGLNVLVSATITTTAVNAKIPGKSYAENCTLVSVYGRGAKKVFAPTLTIAPTQTRSLVRAESAVFAIPTVVAKNVSKDTAEALTLSTAYIRNVSKNQAEIMTLTLAATKNAAMAFAESFRIRAYHYTPSSPPTSMTVILEPNTPQIAELQGPYDWND